MIGCHPIDGCSPINSSQQAAGAPSDGQTAKDLFTKQLTPGKILGAVLLGAATVAVGMAVHSGSLQGMGALLKKFRLVRGWSTDELAQVATVPRKTVKKIEGGWSSGAEVLPLIAKAFGGEEREALLDLWRELICRNLGLSGERALVPLAIKQLRIERRLSHAGLAEKAGLSKMTVQFMENGRRGGRASLPQLERGLGVEPGTLVRLDQAVQLKELPGRAVINRRIDRSLSKGRKRVESEDLLPRDLLAVHCILRGWSSMELSRRTGISVVSISTVLSGSRSGTRGVILKVAQRLAEQGDGSLLRQLEKIGFDRV